MIYSNTLYRIALYSTYKRKHNLENRHLNLKSEFGGCSDLKTLG